MSFRETIKSSSTSEFEFFLSDIHTLKANEIKEGTAYFDTLSVDELTLDDMEIYTKLKNGTLASSEFEVYRASIERTHNKSRIFFAGYIANKLSSDVLHHQFLARKDINR